MTHSFTYWLTRRQLDFRVAQLAEVLFQLGELAQVTTIGVLRNIKCTIRWRTALNNRLVLNLKAGDAYYGIRQRAVRECLLVIQGFTIGRQSYTTSSSLSQQ